MTDCFQPIELQYRVTLKTIEALNRQRIHYLIVTKSHLVANPEYLEILDRGLAHIQITVTTLSDSRAKEYEGASSVSKRIDAIRRLQALGYDVAIRLSPVILEYMDFQKLNDLNVDKAIIEFLRINSWIRKWFSDVDFSRYTLYHGGYYHLSLEEKIRIIDQLQLNEITVCEDVTDHYYYWRDHINPNQSDCCNLRFYNRQEEGGI